MNTARLFLIASIAAALTGCPGQGLQDATFATGTSAMVASTDASAVFVANPNEGSISRVDIDSGTVTEVSGLGSEPTRIARAGRNLVIPLRGDAAIVVLDEETLEEQARIQTGAEPYGVVAREDGSRFYVTISQEGVVEEYDGESLQLLRTLPVGPDVRWMALHPNDRDLYVASPFGGALYWIDLDSGIATPVEIPTVSGLSPEDGTPVPLTPRITGDLAISPDGRQLAVPMMNVENNSPNGDLSAPNPGAVAYYAPPQGGRFNSTVLTTSVIDGGAPADEFWDAILVNASHSDLGQVASYAASVTWGPDNKQLLLTLESSDAIVSLEGSHTPVNLVLGSAAPTRRNSAGELLLQTRQMSVIRTSEGPRGLAFVGDEAFTYTYFDGLIENVHAERLQVGYQQTSRFGGSTGSSEGSTSRVTDTTAWSENALTDDEREGRRMFYSAIDGRMANNGAGVSCSTCHFEGRNDGLTWPLEDGARQTPSLAGGTNDTNPVTWTLSVPSAADEAFATSQGRMGGNGLSVAAANQIGAYIQTIAPVTVSTRQLDPQAIARGAVVFEDAGCDDCHSGARMTDNQSYPMLGLSNVNTPPLTGIAATAPYFHDGSAPTLRDVLVFARSGEMGDTSSLSDAEMADLETYLRSL